MDYHHGLSVALWALVGWSLGPTLCLANVDVTAFTNDSGNHQTRGGGSRDEDAFNLTDLHHRPGRVTKEAEYQHAMLLLGQVLRGAAHRIRPNIYGDPVKVIVDLYIQSFGPIDELNMDIQLGMHFRHQWLDPRLAFKGHPDALTIPSDDLPKLWKPDIYFPNEKSGVIHQLMATNEIVKIYPNGTVWYSARVTVKLDCSMNLAHFPLDYQDCYIKISSYSYDVSAVLLEWRGSSPVNHRSHSLKLNQFYTTNITTNVCEEDFNSGRFSCLIAVFHMRRQVGFYVLSSYIPSILIVMLSWISFWISKDAVPARISLGVTTVLTMTTQLGTAASATMQVSYPKAIDVWYTTCIAFVFASCLEFAIVNVVSRSEKVRFKDEEQRRRSMKSMRDTFRAGGGIKPDEPKKPYQTVVHMPGHTESGFGYTPTPTPTDADGKTLEWPSRAPPHKDDIGAMGNFFTYYLKTSKGIDRGARIIFPLAFIVFNCIYWPYYARKVPNLNTDIAEALS